MDPSSRAKSCPSGETVPRHMVAWRGFAKLVMLGFPAMGSVWKAAAQGSPCRAGGVGGVPQPSLALGMLPRALSSHAPGYPSRRTGTPQPPSPLCHPNCLAKVILFIIFFLQQNPQNRLMGSGWGLGCHEHAKWGYLSSPQLVSALIFGVQEPGRGWHRDAGLDAGRGLRDGDSPQTDPGSFAPPSLPFTFAIRDPEPLPRDKDPLVPCYSWTRLSGTPGDFAEGQLINPHTPSVGWAKPAPCCRLGKLRQEPLGHAGVPWEDGWCRQRGCCSVQPRGAGSLHPKGLDLCSSAPRHGHPCCCRAAKPPGLAK